MPAPLVYAVGVGGAAALNYGAQAVNAFLKDPQNVRDNAARYFSGSPTTGLDQAPNFLSNYQYRASDFGFGSSPNPVDQQRSQFQQLADAKYQRSQGNQTGFADETANTIDDKARSNADYQQWANQAQNRDKNSYSGNPTMATPNNASTNQNQRTNIYSNKASDYSGDQKLQSDYAGYQIKSLSDLQNYANQSADRRYNTDATSNVNLQLGTQKNNVDLTVGLDKNSVTRDVGYYTSNNQLKASNYKSYADLQASLDKNKLQSGDNRYQTDATSNTNRYNIDTTAATDKFKWTTVNPTSVAQEQIKAGTYGLNQQDLANRAADKAYTDKMNTYADRQLALEKYTRDAGQAQVAYDDQQIARKNDQAAAQSRYQIDLNQKEIARQDNLRQQADARKQQREDFNLRSQQINQQANQWQQDYQLRSQLNAAQLAQIYSDTKLKQDQFVATTANTGYNRSQQTRSLAF
jgi:hypothetical protein